jgi:hypothetical protein
MLSQNLSRIGAARDHRPGLAGSPPGLAGDGGRTRAEMLLGS